jgi:Uma2 family endonuclease
MRPVPASDRVSPPRPGVKLTYDDFLLFPDDGLRHELIDGEHYVTPSSNMSHQRVSGRLHLTIGSYLRANPIGELFYAPFDVVFSRFDVVEPDLLYLSNARAAEALTEKNVQGVPNLVVEILSKGTRKRDETIKRRLYERSGVDEYWVVDPGAASIRVCRLAGGRLADAVELHTSDGDRLETPLLPACVVTLSEIFAPGPG